MNCRRLAWLPARASSSAHWPGVRSWNHRSGIGNRSTPVQALAEYLRALRRSCHRYDAAAPAGAVRWRHGREPYARHRNGGCRPGVDRSPRSGLVLDVTSGVTSKQFIRGGVVRRYRPAHRGGLGPLCLGGTEHLVVCRHRLPGRLHHPGHRPLPGVGRNRWPRNRRASTSTPTAARCSDASSRASRFARCAIWDCTSRVATRRRLRTGRQPVTGGSRGRARGTDRR